MEIKQRRAGCFHNIMQRPRVAPIIPLRAQVQRVKGRRHISNDPEDQPHRRPRLSDDHRYILARET